MTDGMTIALFDDTFEHNKPGITGLSGVMWSTARELAKLGIRTHLVGPYPPKTVGPPGVIVNPYSVPRACYRNILGRLLMVFRGWKTIRYELADINIIYTPEYLSSAVFSFMSDLPVVLRTPGNIYERIHSGANPYDVSVTSVLKLAARVSAKRCARIVAISHDMRKWWEYSGASFEKIVVIPNGVDTELFRPISDALTQLGWECDRQHVIFVGRLSKEKGVQLLLQALDQVSRSLPKIVLHIIGDGPERAKLDSLVTHLRLRQNVVFHGWIDTPYLPLYYSASDLLVVPSLTEPQGKVVLEAMACRTPVLGAQTGGLVDHIQEQETGFLFPVGDVIGLASKLESSLQNVETLQSIGKQALSYVTGNCNWPQKLDHVLRWEN